jgi:alkanesulfonate monooxygenase SsuD/methylene tetrahydromethanopterin reductase-like flavin-dependent oxidoreductase (luciferase family)
LAYAALIYVGDTEARARAGAEKLLWYITANKVPQHFSNPPGYVPIAMNVQLARGAQNVVSAFGTKQSTVDGAIEAGTMFAGTPDQVLAQIKKHWNHVGGYGNLLIMGQAGFLEHDDTVHGIRMFAREVYPRLKELYPDTTISGITEPVSAAAS